MGRFGRFRRWRCSPCFIFSRFAKDYVTKTNFQKKEKKKKKKKKKTKPTTTRFADAYNFRAQKTLTLLQTFKLSKLEKHYNVFMVVVQTKPENLKLQQYTFFSLVRRIAIHLKTRLEKKTKIVYQFLSNDTITWESLWETANFFKYVLPQGIAFAPRFQNSDALIIVTINAFYWSPLSTTAKRPIIFFDSSFRFTIVWKQKKFHARVSLICIKFYSSCIKANNVMLNIMSPSPWC